MERPATKHTVIGHLKATGYAVVFGLGAYFVIKGLIWVGDMFKGDM